MQFDAFSSGQIESKVWLVKTLERIIEEQGKASPGGWHIWILAGWYGVTNFIIRTRGRIPISKVRSFDSDPECEPIADKINSLWVWQQWAYKALTQDINTLDYSDPPDLVINSSVEHIHGRDWWDRIPKGTMVCLQSTDMRHEDHSYTFKNLEEFCGAFPFSEPHYQGQKLFQYDEWGFTRYMIIGRK